MNFHGKLYRALNPVYAKEPLSGRGAALYGGRFNPKGVPALYTCLKIETAIREANQVGSLQPTTLVSYEAEIEKVFDTNNNAGKLAKYGMDIRALESRSWRDDMKLHGEAPTQTFARRLFEDGYNGLLVSSFAAGSGIEDLNLVLWNWGDSAPSKLVVVDDEHRLSRAYTS